MEEQILKILNESLFYSREKASKEITAHVFEFIEWIESTGQFYLKFKSTNELYEYWLNNVKK